MKTDKLTINDLMVGDWVMVSDFPLQPIPMQIRPRHFVSDNLRFEPIPLTRELLEKNGITFDYKMLGDDVADIIEGELDLSIHKGAFFLTVQMAEYDITQVHYLHEVQHFFKLCGIEKEWVL